jgi:hypothetical protein
MFKLKGTSVPCAVLPCSNDSILHVANEWLA